VWAITQVLMQQHLARHLHLCQQQQQQRLVGAVACLRLPAGVHGRRQGRAWRRSSSQQQQQGLGLGLMVEVRGATQHSV
jgi:hypothetical protein